MSLIITSSNQTDEIIGNIANEKPFSYTNYFTNGLRIKKNSKVAVQSVKFTRDAIFDISESDTLGLYFGDELVSGDNIENVTSRIVPISLFGDMMRQTTNYNDIKNLTFGPSDYADHLQTVLSNNLYFPDAISKGVKVSVKRDAGTKAFEGFDFKFDQNNDGKKNSTNISGSFTSYWAGNQTSYDYNTNVFTRTATTAAIFGKKSFATGYEYPLSLNGGIMEVDLTALTTAGAKDGWRIGLSRPTAQMDKNDLSVINNSDSFVERINAKNEIPPEIFHNTGGFDHHFYDYLVEYKNKKLTVFQNCRSNDTRLTRMKSVDYYTHSVLKNASGQLTDADFGGGWGIETLRFTAKGEQLELEFYSASETKWITVISPSLNTGKAFNFIPINQARWFLFPRFHLRTKNDAVTINKFSGLNLGLSNTYEAYFNRSFYTLARRNAIPELNGGVIESLELSPLSDISKTDIKTLTTLNASLGTNFNVVMVLGQSQLYRTTNSPIYSFSLTSEFGFDSQSVISQSIFTVPIGSEVNFSSITRPLISSDKSIFVRCNNLTFDSQNGATSSISKILMAVPKFDNRGSEFGALFYDSKELIYLDLNNSEDFILSDLSIDLVNIDERFARGISGNTIVTLVIKR
jgi:hypothetical protein